MKLNRLILIVFMIASHEVMAGYELDDLKVVNKSHAIDRVAIPNAGNVSSLTNQEAQFDKENLLRCWQKGELIVNESGLELAEGNELSGLEFSKKGRKIRAYQYGETFCMYFES